MSELSDVLLAIACPRVGSRGGQQKFKQVGVLDKRSCSSMNIFLNAHIMDIGRVMTSALVLLFKTVLFNSCDGWQATNQTKQHNPPANNLARVAVLASRWYGLQVDDDDNDWMVNGDNDDDYEVEFYPYDTHSGILTSRIFDWWEGKSSVPR